MEEVMHPPKSEALRALYWRSEILQVMFWLKGEGFGDQVDATLLERFLGVDSHIGVQYLDRLLEEGYVEGDNEKRMALYEQAQILIMDDAPLIPVWGKRQLMAGQKSITGIDFNLSVYPLYYNTALGE